MLRWPPPARARTPPSSTTRKRARLRKQALDWLQRRLGCLRYQQLDSGPTRLDRPSCKTLSHWQQDTDLAGIRDAAALAKLPEDEQKAFNQLWTDVAGLLKKAEEEPK